MNPLDQNKDSYSEETEVISITEPTEIPEHVIEAIEQVEENFFSFTKADLIEKLKEIIRQSEKDVKEEVAHIKQVFYKKLKAERDEQRIAFEKENTEGDKAFVPEPDEYEAELKLLLNEYREKRVQQTAQTEAQKEANLKTRLSIIEKLKALIDEPEKVNNAFPVFRELQQAWKDSGVIAPSHVAEVMKTYNLYVETFYDLVKINNDLRDYDFKKNLEIKTSLCEQAESLDKETDILKAFRQLQQLHDEWREIGPVAKELREEIWNRFKIASSVINKKHQSHFDQIKSQEETNLTEKTVLCEQMETIDFSTLNSYKDWDSKTEEVIHIQEAWKKIGFAPRKMNIKIYERYRAACDKFFNEKTEFYKRAKDETAQNLEQKKELVNKALSLKDSTEWKETTHKLVALQKEWKAIGPVPKKYSESIWQEFIGACNYFFEQKEKVFASLKSEEKDNLTQKKELIESIKQFQPTGNETESVTALKALAAKWNEIGHVPFKDKDKIYKEYRTALDAQFDALHVEKSNRRLDSYREDIENLVGKDKNKLFREREKMVRSCENLKSEIKTYENNIGFFGHSKNAQGMMQEMERKIETLKQERDLLLKKIQLIENNL